MIALKIVDVKKFMEKLLVSPMFDHFYVFSADIKVSVTWHLDGSINKDYYSSDELEIMNDRTYILWSEVKHHIFNMIKGKRTPSNLKIVFMLANEPLQKYAENLNLAYEHISALFLNIKFDHSGLTIITGASQKTFSLDRALEQEWDQTLKQFLQTNDIEFE